MTNSHSESRWGVQKYTGNPQEQPNPEFLLDLTLLLVDVDVQNLEASLMYEIKRIVSQKLFFSSLEVPVLRYTVETSNNLEQGFIIIWTPQFRGDFHAVGCALL